VAKTIQPGGAMTKSECRNQYRVTYVDMVNARSPHEAIVTATNAIIETPSLFSTFATVEVISLLDKKAEPKESQ